MPAAGSASPAMRPSLNSTAATNTVDNSAVGSPAGPEAPASPSVEYPKPESLQGSAHHKRDDMSKLNRGDWSRLHVDGPHHDGWYIAKIVLRSFSVVITLALVVLWIVILESLQLRYRSGVITDSKFIDVGINVAFGTFVTLATMWDMAEFITMCCRKGYGITPKAHIGVELTLFIWGTATVAIMSYTVVFRAWMLRKPGTYLPVEEVTAVAGMAGIVVTIRFILFVRNAVDRRTGRGLTPRIMYLQTGEPVVVMRRPYPPRPTRDIEMENHGSPTAATGASSAATLVAAHQRAQHGQRAIRRQHAPPVTATGNQNSAASRPRGLESPMSPASAVASPRQGQQQHQEQPEERQHRQRRHQQEQEQQQQQQQRDRGNRSRQHTASSPPIPRRKPVPPPRRISAGDYPNVPAPDYEPEEAERRRAERGEAQAQWMTLEAMGIRGPASGEKRPLGRREERGRDSEEGGDYR